MEIIVGLAAIAIIVLLAYLYVDYLLSAKRRLAQEELIRQEARRKEEIALAELEEYVCADMRDRESIHDKRLKRFQFQHLEPTTKTLQ